MGLLALLARLLFLRRLLGGGRRNRGYGYGRPRRRTGFYGPFPYYSGRTRRGSRVSVTGCCLPIPLAFAAALAAALRLLTRT